MNRILVSLVVMACLLTGCATSIPKRIVTVDRNVCERKTNDYSGIYVTYLGCGGALFEYGTNAILTGPFFSNYSFVRSGLGVLRPNGDVIDRLLPDVSAVEAILVGHSHYDHLGDIPYILSKGKTAAPVYGNRTMTNLLHSIAAKVPNRLIDVEATAGSFRTNGTTGEWNYIPNKRIRFMALKSMHAPHLLGITLFNGQRKTPRDSLPKTAWGWKCGTPLVFVIDFLEANGATVVYRIVYNDSAVDAREFGVLPPDIEPHKINLAMMCMASFSQVKGYPRRFLNSLQPEEIFIAHWEDFFQPQCKPLKVVRFSEMDDFIEQLPDRYKTKPVNLPAPGSCRYFAVK